MFQFLFFCTDTVETLQLQVKLTSNHPRRLFKTGSSGVNNSASIPKRRSPRNIGGTVATGFKDKHNDLCEVCDRDGDLLCCDSCSLVYHLSCVRPRLNEVPEGEWHCPYCLLESRSKVRTSLISFGLDVS